jgi:hypothetical protein
MCSVPPDTGVAELLAAGVVDDGDDDELHAASPTAARMAADSATTRFGALIMGMFLRLRNPDGLRAASGAPTLTDCLN